MTPVMDFEIVKCKKCNREYKKTTKPMNNRRVLGKGLRGINTKNCSKECSKKSQ